MSALDKTARLVAAETKVDPSMKVGIEFILIIIEILQAIFPILQNVCGLEPEEVVSKSKRPTRMQKVWLRLVTRRVMGRKAFREHGGKAIAAAVTKVGSKSTVQEVQDVYDEV